MMALTGRCTASRAEQHPLYVFDLRRVKRGSAAFLEARSGGAGDFQSKFVSLLYRSRPCSAGVFVVCYS